MKTLANLEILLKRLDGHIGGLDPIHVIVVGKARISAKFGTDFSERYGKKFNFDTRVFLAKRMKVTTDIGSNRMPFSFAGCLMGFIDVICPAAQKKVSEFTRFQVVINSSFFPQQMIQMG